MIKNNSSFTFCLKGGDEYVYEMEPFFINSKSNLIEPLSASPRTTPREKKIPFGPIAKVFVIDDEYFKIENSRFDQVVLEVSKLSPLIDREDGRFKKELLNLQSKGAMPLVSALNDMIFKLHEDKFRKKMSPRLDRQDTLPQRNLSRDSQEEKAGKRNINSPSQISSSQSQPANEQKVSQSEKEGSSNGMSKKTSSRYSLRSSQKAKKQTSSVNEKNTSSEGFSETKDIMEYCEDIVSECVFKMIISDDIQVPNSLRVDHERVAELKSMLQTTPDKTQTFLGLVCATNEDDDRTSPFWVYVNVEMFIALK